MSEISPAEARQRLAAGDVVLVDVREPDEWAAGHAPGSLHRPLADLDPGEFADATVITTCRGGGRGSRAAQQLRDGGVDAVSLAGGLSRWADDGGALVTDDGSAGTLDP